MKEIYYVATTTVEIDGKEGTGLVLVGLLQGMPFDTNDYQVINGPYSSKFRAETAFDLAQGKIEHDISFVMIISPPTHH